MDFAKGLCRWGEESGNQTFSNKILLESWCVVDSAFCTRGDNENSLFEVASGCVGPGNVMFIVII